jgi:uncharacterized protein
MMEEDWAVLTLASREPYNGYPSVNVQAFAIVTGTVREEPVMDLKARLLDDLKTAVRQHDDVARDAIRLARAAIINAEIQLQREISDPEVARILSKEVVLRKEAAEELQRAGRDDLGARELADVAILVRYLPELMPEHQIRAQAAAVIQEMGASSSRDMGPVMRELMARLSGRADGSLVHRIVCELLSP